MKLPFTRLALSTLLGIAFVARTSGCPLGEVTAGQQALLTASDANNFDLLGTNVSMWGDSLLVACRGSDDARAGADAGAAYVYTRESGTWLEQAKLVPGDALMGAQFGYSVAIEGDIALIGAPNKFEGVAQQQGAAYIFVRSGSEWTQQQKLLPTDGLGWSQFGSSVALSGDRAVIGSSSSDGVAVDSGVAYVFQRSGSTWSQEARLFAQDGGSFDYLGTSVSIHGTTVVAGAPQHDAGGLDAGAAYVFVHTGSGWVQQAKLQSNAPNELLGRSVSVSEDTVLAGAPFADDLVGATYVFRRSGSSWVQESRLAPDDPGIRENFGASVAIRGNRALIGATSSAFNAGAAFVFDRIGTAWTEELRIERPGLLSGDRFGVVALSTSTDIVAVGAPGDEPPQTKLFNSGTVTVYRLFETLGCSFCFGSFCPCGNQSLSSGCINSTGAGSVLSGTAGSRSVAADDLVLTATDAPPGNSGLFLMGDSISPPGFLGDGLACTGGLFRFLPSVVSGSGELTLTSPVAGAPAGQITAGDTRYFQAWTRDVLCGPPPSPCPSPCGTGSNLSSGFYVTFIP